jgi:hypothetical protein
MLIAKTKTKPAAQPEAPEGNAILKKALQNWVDLNEQIRAIKAEAAKVSQPLKGLGIQLEEAAREIKEQLPEIEAKKVDEALEVIKEGYLIDIGTVPMTRHIHDLPGLREHLGEENFMTLATVKLGDIDKYVSKVDQEKFITASHDLEGRSVKVTPMGIKPKKS